jgi:DNA-binding NtrC family response regulator
LARLLLVEDESIARFQLTQFLTDEGYTVIPVASGEEALKLFQNETFDVVITDFKLTGAVTGTDVLKAFERMRPGKGKVFLTAYPPHEVQAESVGALYVPKPVQLDDLLIKLKTFS